MEAKQPTLSARRVLGEGAVIVCSILLALALDATWDSIQDRREEQAILAGLEAEFEGYRIDLERGRHSWDSIAGEIDGLFETIESGGEVPLERSRVAISGLLIPRTYDPGSGVRDAVIASGRLELLRSDEVRRRLVAWQGVLREVQDNEAAMRDYILHELIPFLAARGVPLGVFGGRGPPGMSEQQELANYRSLFRDPEFLALASVRKGFLNVSMTEYGAATRFVEELVLLIRAGRD